MLILSIVLYRASLIFIFCLGLYNRLFIWYTSCMEKSKDKKLTVVGWVDYDDEYFPEAPTHTQEMFDAVVEEVKKHGYLFGGDSHQDRSNCCPVLSNGYKMCCSWRGWGAVIGAAYRNGKKRQYEYMDGYMDMLIKPEALRYPPEGVDCALIDAPRYFHAINMPPSRDPWDYTVLHVLPSTPETKIIEPYDYIKFVHTLDNGEQIINRARVQRVYTGTTVAEVLQEVDDTYWGIESWLFGYDLGLTNEQIIENIIADYGQEAFDEFGVTCILTKELDAGEHIHWDEWIPKKDKI